MLNDEDIGALYQVALTAEWREMPPAARADIPQHLRQGLDLYVMHRVRTGDFLYAVLSNDLREASLRCHPVDMMARLPALLQVLCTYAPACCHGSPEAVKAWLREREES